jgi:ribonuclease HI
MPRKTRHIEPAESVLTVFTDGSSLPSPRRGGIGIKFVYTDRDGLATEWELQPPGRAGATNNEMELLAVITALKEIQGHRFRHDLLDEATRIDIYSDSQYVVDHIYTAMGTWPRNGWMTSAGPPVENVQLWKDLVREYKKVSKIKRVEIKWGKGPLQGQPAQQGRRPARQGVGEGTLAPADLRGQRPAKDHLPEAGKGQRQDARPATYDPNRDGRVSQSPGRPQVPIRGDLPRKPVPWEIRRGLLD